MLAGRGDETSPDKVGWILEFCKVLSRQELSLPGVSATSRNDSLSFLPSSLLLAENLFFRDRTCSLSIYPYLISLREGKGNVEANPDKKPRLFSDSYQI